jgi:hypothetical protein
MPLVQLARSRWQAYFDGVSRALGATRVEIEVTGLGLGDQVEAEWIALAGISFDPKDDVLIIAAEGLRHLIAHPRQIHVEEELGSLRSLEAADAEGNHHIVILRDALALPALEAESP